MRRTLSAATLVAAVLVAEIAPAADDAAPVPDVTATFNEAVRLANQGDVTPALGLFTEVARADPYWADAYYNLGSLSEHAGLHQDCALYFRRYLQLVPDDADRGDIERSIAACEAALPNAGTLAVVVTSPGDAHVALDGVRLGDGGLGPVTLAAGSYTVSVTRADWVEASREVTVEAGGAATLEVALEPVPLYGSLRLQIVQDGARVLVDGVQVGVSPLTEPLRLVVGDYTIEVLMDGYHPWRRNVDVLRDLEDVIDIRLIDESVDLSRYGQ